MEFVPQKVGYIHSYSGGASLIARTCLVAPVFGISEVGAANLDNATVLASSHTRQGPHSTVQARELQSGKDKYVSGRASRSAPSCYQPFDV